MNFCLPAIYRGGEGRLNWVFYDVVSVYATK